MARSTIAKRDNRTFDKFLELRDYAATALAASGVGTGLLFYPRQFTDYRVTIKQGAYTGYAAGATFWTYNVQVSPTLGGTYTTVASLTPSSGAAQELQINVNSATVERLVPTADYIRIQAVETGTAGDLTYGAYITGGEI